MWAYLTDSEKRGKWLAPGEMELRVGGRVSLTFNNQNLSSDKVTPERFKFAEGHTIEGEVTRYEPPRLLTFTWGKAGDVTFELTPKGKDVLFVVTHRRLPDRNTTVMVSSGWHTHAGVLIDVLNNAEPRPFWKTFLQREAGIRKAHRAMRTTDTQGGCNDRTERSDDDSTRPGHVKNGWPPGSICSKDGERAHAAQRRAGAAAAGAAVGQGRQGLPVRDRCRAAPR